MFGILRAESGEVGGEVLPETAVKRRFAPDLLAVLVTAQGLPVIIVTSILLGIVTKGTVPVLQTLLVEPVTDPQAYDDLFAVNTFARGSTNILTPLLFGFIASAFSAEYIYVLMAIVSVFAVAPVLFGRPMRA